MSILFVDACPRARDISRSHQLGEAFLKELTERNPNHAVETLRLADLRLTPFDGDRMEMREQLIDAGKMNDPIFALAQQFASADGIVIAAPYWDFSFPSMLKVYVEHIFARTVTFVYRDDRPVGLCRARHMIYLTTAGSPIGTLNFGGDYLRGIAGILGIGQFDQISAEALDIKGADVAAIMDEAKACARALARHIAL